MIAEWHLLANLASWPVTVLTAHQLRLVADYHAKRWVGFAALDGVNGKRAESARLSLGAVLDEFQRRSVDLDSCIPGIER